MKKTIEIKYKKKDAKKGMNFNSGWIFNGLTSHMPRCQFLEFTLDFVKQKIVHSCEFTEYAATARIPTKTDITDIKKIMDEATNNVKVTSIKIKETK